MVQRNVRKQIHATLGVRILVQELDNVYTKTVGQPGLD
jgi:hypothetical protein